MFSHHVHVDLLCFLPLQLSKRLHFDLGLGVPQGCWQTPHIDAAKLHQLAGCENKDQHQFNTQGHISGIQYVNLSVLGYHIKRFHLINSLLPSLTAFFRHWTQFLKVCDILRELLSDVLYDTATVPFPGSTCTTYSFWGDSWDALNQLFCWRLKFFKFNLPTRSGAIRHIPSRSFSLLLKTSSVLAFLGENNSLNK